MKSGNEKHTQSTLQQMENINTQDLDLSGCFDQLLGKRGHTEPGKCYQMYGNKIIFKKSQKKVRTKCTEEKEEGKKEKKIQQITCKRKL